MRLRSPSFARLAPILLLVWLIGSPAQAIDYGSTIRSDAANCESACQSGDYARALLDAGRAAKNIANVDSAVDAGGDEAVLRALTCYYRAMEKGDLWSAEIERLQQASAFLPEVPLERGMLACHPAGAKVFDPSDAWAPLHGFQKNLLMKAYEAVTGNPCDASSPWLMRLLCFALLGLLTFFLRSLSRAT